MKIILTQMFGFDWILYHFVPFLTNIFRSVQILQLPRLCQYFILKDIEKSKT